MNEYEQGLYDYLKQFRILRHRMIESSDNSPQSKWAYLGMEDLLIREGRWYTSQALPEKYKLGPIKLCFNNSWELAMKNRNLRYVEGIAHAIIPVHHAWLTDEEGNVIDPTLRDYEGRQASAYIGIEFPLAKISKALFKGATMLDDWMGKDGFAIYKKPFKHGFYELRGREVQDEIGVREIDRDAAAVDEAG